MENCGLIGVTRAWWAIRSGVPRVKMYEAFLLNKFTGCMMHAQPSHGRREGRRRPTEQLGGRVRGGSEGGMFLGNRNIVNER
jgi:hypothetical protein